MLLKMQNVGRRTEVIIVKQGVSVSSQSLPMERLHPVLIVLPRCL